MKSDETPVKASELIKALEGADIDAEIVDEGDLAPVFRGVSVVVGDDHVCSVSGSYMFIEDSPRHGVDPGCSEAKVLGVVFSKSVMGSDVESAGLSGRAIEYDGDLTEDDVIRAAESAIFFPGYDPDDYGFEPESVDDDELRDAILDELPDGTYALDSVGQVCCFEPEESLPEDFREISREEAADQLVADRDSIPFDLA